MDKKVLMSMVVASISAMAIAPELIRAASATELDNVGNNISKDTTNLSTIQKLDTQLDFEIKKQLQDQVHTFLEKKSPIMQISESVSILVKYYGENDKNIEEMIFNELGFAAADSTNLRLGSLSQPGLITGDSQSFCHAACHSNCHGNCHGSRGWR